MIQRNPFLEDDEVKNPFLEDETKPSKQTKISPTELQKKVEQYDILGWPMRKATKAMSTMGQDIAEAVPNLLTKLMGLPSEVMGTGMNIAYDRPRLARQALLAAPANVANTLINTPPMIGRYASHLGLAPNILSTMPYADYSEEIQKYLIGGEKRPGDVLVSNWPQILGGYSLLKNLMKGKGISALPSAESAELTAAKAAETATKRQAAKTIGKSEPESIEYNIGQKQNKLKGINEDISNLANEIDSIQIPEKATGDNAHLQNVENLEHTLTQSNKTLPHVEAIHENATHELNKVENDIGNHLETGAEHHVDASRLLKKDLEKLHEQNKENYSELENNLSNENITIDNSKQIIKLNNEISKLIHEGGLETDEVKNLAKNLQTITNDSKIPASQYVSAYKAVKGYARDAFKKAFKIGINEDERNLWRDRGNQAINKLNEMEKVLQDNLPDKAYSSLKDADSFWYKNIRPLYDERLYWNIMNREKMPKNISEALAGGVEGSGLDIIKNLANNNPRVLKHIVGERWESPSGRRTILNPNARMQSYINNMPELNDLLGIHQQTQSVVNRANLERQKANFHHNVLEERHKEAVDYAKKRQSEIKEQTQLHEEKTAEKEKLIKEHERKTKEREEIKKSIEDHIEHMKKLYEVRDKKENLEKSFKAQQDIKKAQNEMKKKVSSWKKAGKISKSLIMGEYGIKEFKRLLKHLTD